jgi:3-hydroxyisobutyrate dehydrogenase
MSGDVVHVGFVGLGNMGGLIARRIFDSEQFRLIAFDVDSTKTSALSDAGIAVAGSVVEVAAHADVIGICVLDDVQVLSVLTGKDGIFTHARPGTTIFIHSSVSPATTHSISVAAQERDMSIIDATIAGGIAGAALGQLTLMLGGELAAIERCRPVFDTYATTLVHVGATGMGQAAKAINQILAMATHVATKEALRVAESAGIRQELMLEVLNASSGRSWASQKWLDFQEFATTYPTGADGLARDVFAKDMAIGMAIATQAQISVPVMACAAQRYRWLVDAAEPHGT